MPKLDTDRIISAIRLATAKTGYLALHEPEFRGNEKAYLTECIDSTFVSSVGEFVTRFESMLSAATGAKHTIACVNGTAALQVCLRLVGVERDQEVIIPSLTFVATANSVSYLGAIPHFVDCDARTLGLSPACLVERLNAIGKRSADGVVNMETGRRIAAVVPMHTFGHPADMAGIQKVCREWGLPVVEDATEALGSSSGNAAAGTLGDVAALSFNGNKIITTGGGGAILTNDSEMARRAKHLTTTAKLPHRWAFDHDEIGYNYRLPNLNAALGCAQMESLDDFVARKRRLADQYQRAFADVPGVSLFVEPTGTKSNYWLNALLIDRAMTDQRDALLGALNDAGVMARPVWNLLHRLEIYAHCPRGPLDVSEYLEARIVNIPSSPALAHA